MLYILIEGGIGEWLEDFYEGRTPSSDPLYHFLHPEDLRGEVNAWGGPHLTVSDALRVTDAEEFAQIARSKCLQYESPEVVFEGLAVYRTALVITCRSKQLNDLRLALLEKSSYLIERERITKEEFDEALSRIRSCGGADQNKNEQALDYARQQYELHDSPELPTSVHFRLPFLVGLCRAKKWKSLKYFLDRRQPPWYSSRSSLHLTICSGLKVDPTDDRARRQLIQRATEDLWPEIVERLGPKPYRPTCLSVMRESHTQTVHTKRYDGITREHVEEERPAFEECERLSFKS